eukprot:TRINITY_DN21091_c0_g1_i1.p1 TRINITY_DN21091_c0_g1~~TRINITY_DN21091_c0_g1_i1.p1  ORF type:complete len:199 (+),score=44.91 TRINITY_DN21091_c0_g1_i1:105-701(+)
MKLYFLAIAAITAAPVRDEPKFCHDLNCPQFQTVNTTNSYEVREYSSSQWARVTIPSKYFDEAQSQGFQELFDYIGGDNSANARIAMTTPVAVKVLPGAGPYCDSFFTVSFMVPFKDQPSPPTPNNHNITIETEAAHVAYVSSFGGFAKGDDFVQQAGNLASALAEDNVQFNSTIFYAATYDGPYTITNRYNEVWFYA